MVGEKKVANIRCRASDAQAIVKIVYTPASHPHLNTHAYLI
jgi:hypothetical protein